MAASGILFNSWYGPAVNSTQRAIADHLLGERTVGMAEVGEFVVAA
jgi:hypothetical protein